jgi:type II secretory ATPase GspE/PulE/Tfp pilus assembly ATPase PilB-like protein
MDLNDRRKPQTGSMKALLDGRKRDLKVSTAGTNAGETLSVDVDMKQRYELTIDQLGFSADQLNAVEEIIAEGQGIVLVAAPKGHGLTSLLYAILRRHDAFLSHIQTLEREPQADLEGITQNKLPGGSGEEAKQVAWLASQQPDILAVDRVEDPRSAQEIANYASSGRRAYVGLRAGSTFEALQTWRNMVGDDKVAMKDVRLVIAARLMRRLCGACKQDFNPDPDTLRKLNMPPERVGKLFTARTTPLKDNRGRDMVCDFCLDIRFKGRIGIFELFIIDNEVKQVIQAGGSVNQLKMLFKKQRQKYLQEQALAVAVSGESSLNEVARVLKAGDAGGGTSSSGRKSSSSV